MTGAQEKPSAGSEATPISVALARAATTLAEADVIAARVDAEFLAAHVLGVPRSRLILVDGFRGDQLARFENLIARRAARVPVQHLVGEAGFRYLDLAVGPGGFVPRPETELLVDWGLAAVGARPAPIVVDLCSGTGAVALAVANELPGARVTAVERSPAALEWLRRNAQARVLAGDPPVEVVEADVTDPDALPYLSGAVDLVLCNPPYVPTDTPVPPEVAEHDPAEAIFGGADGLAVIRPVIRLAARLLRPGGGLAIEHDEAHERAVPDLLRADGGFVEVRCHPDLAGRPRFSTARRTD